MALLPFFVNLKDKKCVAARDGRVASRKKAEKPLPTKKDKDFACLNRRLSGKIHF